MGMRACALKASELGFDTYHAQLFVLDYLKSCGSSTAENITEEAREFGLAAHDQRAWGSVFYTLHKHKMIKILRADMPRRFGHNTTGAKLWALC